MQVHITGRHVDITDGIREHVYQKVERTLIDFPRVEDVRIILELQKLEHTAEVLGRLGVDDARQQDLSRRKII